MGILEPVRAKVMGELEPNVGGADRVVRVVVGTALAGAGVLSLAGVVTVLPGVAGPALAVAMALVGLSAIESAITRKCPGNAILGRNTCTLDGKGGRPTSDEPGPESVH